MSTAIQSDPYAPFLAEAFQEFRIWMNQNKAKSRFTEEKRTEYCHWIRNPDLKPEPGPDQQRRWNHKYEAVLHYRIHDDDGKLYRTATAKRDQGRANRRVICDSEIFDRIREVHLELGHAGVNKVASAVTDRYHGIRKKEVDWLLKRCQTCVLKRQNRSHTPLEPVVFNPPLERIHTEPIGIVSRPLERIQVEPTSVVNRPLERIQTEPISIVNRPLERVQIDLVDFRHEPDRLYWWVLYIEDHFSKFTSLYPLKSKAPRDVAGCMAQWIGMFGHPEDVQCDNSHELKGYLIELLKSFDILIVSGRSQTPRTQGLIGQANGTMQYHVRCWQSDMEREGLDSRRWASALPRIALAINCQGHTSLRMRKPYEVFFGRNTRWDDDKALPRLSEYSMATLGDIPDEECSSDGENDEMPDQECSSSGENDGGDGEEPEPVSSAEGPEESMTPLAQQFRKRVFQLSVPPAVVLDDGADSRRVLGKRGRRG